MANASYIQPSFLGGEWSPLMQGRIDLPKYRTAMNICLNGIPVEEGAWVRRSGFRQLGPTRFGALGRVIGWEWSEGRPLLLEFTNGFLRAYQGDYALDVAVSAPAPALSLLTDSHAAVLGISEATPAVVTVQGLSPWANGDQVMFSVATPAGSLIQLQNWPFTIGSITEAGGDTSFTIADGVTGAPIMGFVLRYLQGMVLYATRIAEVATPWTFGGVDGPVFTWTALRLISIGQSGVASTTTGAGQAVLLTGPVQPQVLTAVNTNQLGGATPTLSLQPAAFSDGPYQDVVNGAQMISTVSGNAGVLAQFPGWDGGAGGATINVGQLVGAANQGYNFVCIQTQPDSQANFQHWFTSYPTESSYYALVTDTAPFAAYNGGTAYSPAQVVIYSGLVYVCIQAGTGHEPDTSTAYWTPVALQNQTAITGEVAFDLSFTAWSSTTAYNVGDVSSFSGVNYQSTQDNNIGQEPDTSPTYWVSGINSGLPFSPGGATSTDVGRAVRLFYQPPAWNSATTYEASGGYIAGQAGNLVTYDGAYYQAQFTNTTQGPNVNKPPASSLTYWLPITGAAIAGWTWGIVTAVNSETEVVINIVGDPFPYAATAVLVYQTGAYSNTTGWPTDGIFYQGRLWLAGAAPNRIDGSSSDSPFVFSPTQPDGTVADNNAISIVFNSTDNELVQWLAGVQQGILVGTLAHERLVSTGTQSDILTPATSQENPVTKYGGAFVQPVGAGLATVFVQRFGQQIMEMVANVFSGRYNAPNLALPAKHLTVGVVEELAYQEEQTPIIWARLGTGQLIGCTYRRVTAFSTDNPALTNEPSTFAAWHRHTLGSGRTVYSITRTQTPGGLLDQLAMVAQNVAQPQDD